MLSWRNLLLLRGDKQESSSNSVLVSSSSVTKEVVECLKGQCQASMVFAFKTYASRHMIELLTDTLTAAVLQGFQIFSVTKVPKISHTALLSTEDSLMKGKKAADCSMAHRSSGVPQQC